jgi:hypothetical protein
MLYAACSMPRCMVLCYSLLQSAATHQAKKATVARGMFIKNHKKMLQSCSGTNKFFTAQAKAMKPTWMHFKSKGRYQACCFLEPQSPCGLVENLSHSQKQQCNLRQTAHIYTSWKES